METLLTRVEYESKRLKNFFNEADKTLTSLHSDVVSYKNNKGVSGWNVFLWVVGGAGLGALGKELPRVFLVAQDVNYNSWGRGCN